MVDQFWPEAKASIVLLPSGEQGEAILELAGEWTKMGLLGHALWVLPEQVDGSVTGPPRIEASVLGVGHDLEITRVRLDLFEALAREALAVVRLVKLRSAVPSRELDAVQDAIAERVREYVRKSMPMPNPNATVLEQHTDLRNASLICAPTEFQLQERVDWASGEYGVVVVASPEDRSSPWSGDAFVRENDRFVGFTLMHLASVAGLWNGVGKGSFELFHREESGHESVWISRVFIKAILTESLAQRTAARVLEEAARPDSLLVDPSVSPPPAGTAFIEDALVGGYVDDMVHGAMSLDGGALGFREPRSTSDPERRRVGFWRSIGRFFAFSAEKLLRMPYWAWRWLTSRTTRRLTRALYTDDGAETVGGQIDDVFDVRDRMLIAETHRIREAEQAARAQANAPAGLAHVRTTPRLWSRLRELVFGSLDGSADLSEVGFAPIEGHVPIFGRVSDVLALPGEPWSRPADQVPEGFPDAVDWYALALRDPRERLDDWVAEAATRRSEAEVAITALSAEIETLQSRLPARVNGGTDVAPPAPADVELPPPPPDAVPADIPLLAPIIDPQLEVVFARLAAASAERETARSEFYRADAEHTARTRTLEDFDAWAATQDRSFIWRLLTTLSAERRDAERMSQSLSEQIEKAEPPKPGDLLRLRRRFHRTMIAVWVSALAIAGFAGLVIDTIARQDSTFDWQFWLWVTLGTIAGIALLLTFGSLIQYHSGWSRFQRRIDVETVQLGDLGRNSRHARQEAMRLTSLHRQTVDWLVLLSKAIHRPWHVQESWLEREPYEVARGAMPFALGIATIQDDDYAATSRLRGAMTEQLVVRGWRHDAFESLVREVAWERGAMSGSFGLAALDEDLPHSSNHTRTMLLAALENERLLTRVAGPRLQELVKSAQRDELRDGRPRVVPVGDNPLDVLVRPADAFQAGAHDVAWDDFLIGALADRRDPVTPLSATVLAELELGERHHERVTSYLVLPKRVASRLAFGDSASVSIVPFAATGTGPVDLSWRVDIAGPVPKSAIRLWTQEAARQRTEPEARPTRTGPVDSGV